MGEADEPHDTNGARPSRTPGPARAGTLGPAPADALDPDPVQAAAVRTDAVGADADAAAVRTAADTDTDTDTDAGPDAPRGGPDAGTEADSLPPGDANPDAPAVRAPGTGRGGAPRGLSTGGRGPVDPVKALMHRHRALCERAVDPLEIAAGLEAHGVTDRTAARYRHRDVFSLAEELFARVPGVAGESAEAPCAPARDVETRAAWSLRALLPGAACLATFVTLRLTDGVLGGGARLAVGGGGALLALVCLAVALRSGPLSARGRATGATGPLCCWLLGYVVYGEAFLHQVLTGGPEGPWDLTPAPLLGLAVALAPAAWCAHLFSVHAHRRLRGSRALEEFAAGVRPLLFAAVAAFLCVLAVLLHLAGLGAGPGGSAVGAAALGVLLLLARLLTVHGFPEPAATGLGVACAVEAAAPALILAGQLPGLDLVARPVRALVEAGGTGAVPALACAAAALGLLVTATAALSRASAHTAP
ncbi:hypothetical protein [Streptomyces sp. NPDC057682]|uniref:hypothetical protein n=1 Tax=Streptomyces sp. NPDC057682 TaxID=3346210 RepID=UPI00367754EB